MKIYLKIWALVLSQLFNTTAYCQDTSNKKVISDIRKKYESIVNLKTTNQLHCGDTIKYECDDYPECGVIYHYYKDKSLVLIEVVHSDNRHCDGSEEYYINNNQLFFLFKEHSCWSFDMTSDDSIPKTVDCFTEERLYFRNSEIIKCLEKRVCSNEDKNIDDVPNQECTYYGNNEESVQLKKLISIIKLPASKRKKCVLD